jgi:hypothetical protein
MLRLFEIPSARIMKHLAAMEIVGEISADVYVSTPLSMALTVPKYRDGISYWSAPCVSILCPYKYRLRLRLASTAPAPCFKSFQITSPKSGISALTTL